VVLTHRRFAPDLEPVLLDLADYRLPDFRSDRRAMGRRNIPTEMSGRSGATPFAARRIRHRHAEYNQRLSRPLKNALDHLFRGWRGKPVASSATAASPAARAACSNCGSVIELHCAPLRGRGNIPLTYETLDANNAPVDPILHSRRAVAGRTTPVGRARCAPAGRRRSYRCAPPPLRSPKAIGGDRRGGIARLRVSASRRAAALPDQCPPSSERDTPAQIRITGACWRRASRRLRADVDLVAERRAVELDHHLPPLLHAARAGRSMPP